MEALALPAQDLAAQHDEPVVTHWASHLRFWIPAALLLWLDLWSKQWVFANLAAEDAYIVIPAFLEFRRSLNDGAVFGSFTGYVSVFIVASLFALAFVFYLFVKSTRRQWSLHMSLALILAGAIGNLYDRAFIKADVVRHLDTQRQRPNFIGRLLSDPGEDPIRIGEWPDGTHPKTFQAENVTLHRQGVVRDFIKFTGRFPKSVPKVGGYDIWPWIFNVADASLVCGVAILLLHCWFDRKPRTASEPG